jgi:signal transduction histidine kinase
VVRGVVTAPRVPWLAGTLFVLAALLELAARTSVTSAMQAQAVPGEPSHTVTASHTLAIGNTVLSAQAVILLYALALAATLPPVFLGPVTAAMAVTAANAFSLGEFHIVTVAGAVVQLVAACRFGRSGSRVWAAALALPFLALALSAANPPGTASGVVTMLLVLLVPASALAGLASRARGESLARSAAQEAIATTLLAHTARGERARIARELHDVVAHHISMIAVQAETARLATPGMPDTGARRLLEIGDTARAALTEMRRLLGVLREDARDSGAQRVGAPERPAAERRPQPGLEQLNDLLDGARNASATGLRLIVSGSPATLDPGVELAAYRIIQEALTNARRHAPGAAVDVEVHYEPDQLRLRVRDNGPGAPTLPPPAGGHGLLGMRERAVAVGGRLRTGPADLGGYLVEATLPAKAEDIA